MVVLSIGFVVLCIAALGYCVALGLVAAGVDIGFPGEDTGQRLMWLLLGPVLLLGMLWTGGTTLIVRRLQRLFDSFTSGEPFKKENADHLRVIWVTMLILEVAKIIIIGVAFALVASHGMLGEIKSDADADIHFDGVDLSPWISILILIVLAEVFREGARLREEQDLTI
jgi:cytochrome bd-type quinol oxidase subunit 2